VTEFRLQYRGTSFPVRSGEVTLGRSSYASIVVNNPLASREHAVVRRAGARLEVADLGSKNGTYVNGRRITGPCPVDVGDVLRVGTEAIEITRTSVRDPAAHRVATEPGRGSIHDDAVDTTVNFRRSLDLAESLIGSCTGEAPRRSAAETVAQILDAFLSDYGQPRGAELERVRGIVRSLEAWHLDGSVEEWRKSFEARLDGGATGSPPA
jgi:pSer/pThr/pTyr-binding forkhead associated (FHA) protein